MDRKLNKLSWLLLLVFAALTGAAQEERIGDKDYKDPAQFEKFARRRKVVSSWQISQLREGALVVRLKTNHLLINTLLKRGDKKTAETVWLETYTINRNTMRAYMKMYSFSKLYFIFGNSSDSLLNGARSHIFLDTNLLVDPSITMTADFYLLAERDYSYNSSIGYVPEDSARLYAEHGSMGKERAVVVKNKYGHQLKHPFPYYVNDGFRGVKKSSQIFEYLVIPNPPDFVNGGQPGKTVKVAIPRYARIDRLSLAISDFSQNLTNFYRMSPHLKDIDLDPSIKPFLY